LEGQSPSHSSRNNRDRNNRAVLVLGLQLVQLHLLLLVPAKLGEESEVRPMLLPRLKEFVSAWPNG
jgi:hypothetical protein